MTNHDLNSRKAKPSVPPPHTRRKFLQASVIAPVVATASAPAIVSAKTKKLKMVTSWPKNFPGVGVSAARLAKRIEKASQGRYKIRIYSSGELVHPLKCLDAVQEGTADLYHSADYYYKGKSPAFPFFTGIPFGFTANEMHAWLYHGGGQSLWDELNAQFNIKPFAVGNTGVQMGGWFKKPIISERDIKGLKMRIPGLGGDVINALGGTSVSLGGTEIMPALQAGTIDATEFVGPWNDLAFGFYKVVKNYMYPGFHEPSVTFSLGINKKLWDKMSNQDQLMFDYIAMAENSYGFAEYNANNGNALDTLVNKHGVTLHKFPDEVFKSFGEATKDLLADITKKDAMTRKVYQNFISFYRDIKGYTRISEQAYTNGRDLYNL